MSLKIHHGCIRAVLSSWWWVSGCTEQFQFSTVVATEMPSPAFHQHWEGTAALRSPVPLTGVYQMTSSSLTMIHNLLGFHFKIEQL